MPRQTIHQVDTQLAITLRLIKRVAIACGLGVLTYFSLGLFPYFPLWMVLVIAGTVCVLGFHHPRCAAALSMAAFAVTISYHSLALCCLYWIAVIIFLTVTIDEDHFPLIFLMVAGTPFLAHLQFLNFPIPFEFAAIFFVPLMVSLRKVPLVVGIACLWTCLAGMVFHRPFMGNLIVGGSESVYFVTQPSPTAFYDFSWAFSQINTTLLPEVWRIAGLMYGFVRTQPLVIVQVAGWALVGSVIKLILERYKQWYFEIVAGISGVILLLLLESVVVRMASEQMHLDVLNFFFVITPMAAVMVGVCRLKPRPERLVQPVTAQRSSVVSKPSPQGSAFRVAQTEDIQKVLRKKRPSLEDSLRMQKYLGDYIKKRFVHEVTILDIDIAQSTKLKREQTQENIVFSFTEYWRFVDGAVNRSRGRLLNRAGDGALYLFTYADQSIYASQDILKGLDRFNRKVNTLKDEFRVRIGINTGTIVEDVQKSSSDVFSHVLDIAGHLQKMAASGAILITGRTYEHLHKTKNLFEFSGYSENDQVQIYHMKGLPGRATDSL